MGSHHRQYVSGLHVNRRSATNSECSIFAPQPLRAVGVLFSPMVSRWAGEVCPACISETIRCKKLILGRDIG